MTTLTPNLRKAAVLIRSLDADTAASMLAQLSPSEAKSVRLAIQSLGGPVDPDEQAELVAEFRRRGPVVQEDLRRGVELNLSTAFENRVPQSAELSGHTKPFEFLEQASIEALVPYLAREHGQTVAVVLSYLAPTRAVAVLAALPPRLQAETMERLSALGDTDPASLQVIEQELSRWLARQQAGRSRNIQRPQTVTALLAAADETTRSKLLANLSQFNQSLAHQLAPAVPDSSPARTEPTLPQAPLADSVFALETPPSLPPRRVPPIPIPQIQFEQLTRLDRATLSALLKAVDAEVLTLALVGASEAVVDHIVAQMPRSVGKTFRKRIHAVGPTRLRDVHAAQQDVANIAARILSARHTKRRVLN